MLNIINDNNLHSKFLLVSILDGLYTFHNQLVSLFGVIYFFQLTNSIWLAFLPFILGRFLSATLLLLLSSPFGKLGTKVGMYLGWSLIIMSGIPIYIYNQNHNIIWVYIWLITFFTSKAILFVPWLYLMGKYSDHQTRGSQFAFKQSLMIIASVLAPLSGGFLSRFYGLEAVFAGASAVMILGLLIIQKLPNKHIQINIKLPQFYKTHKAKSSFLSSLIFELNGTGAEQLWLILLFLATGGSFQLFGTYITFSILVSLALTLTIGKILNKGHRTRSFQFISIITGLIQIARSLKLFPLISLEVMGRVLNGLHYQVFEVYWFDLVNHKVAPNQRDELTVVFLIHNALTISMVFIIAGLLTTLFKLNNALLIMGCITILLPILLYRHLRTHKQNK